MDLTDTEIDNICAGYVQSAAKVRYLKRLGLMVRQKPNGKPLVNRIHYNSVMACTAAIPNAKFDNNQPVWGVH